MPEEWHNPASVYNTNLNAEKSQKRRSKSISPKNFHAVHLGTDPQHRGNSKDRKRNSRSNRRCIDLLDLSPSASNPDLLSNGTLVSQVMPALRISLTNLVRPFYVPGSQLLLKPDIYVTVIAWTPFIAEGAQAVLCQGCLVTPKNVDEVLQKIVNKLSQLEKRSFEVSADVNSVMTNMRAEAERLTCGLFEEDQNVTKSVSMLSNVATTTADSGFIAMIRTGTVGYVKIWHKKLICVLFNAST